MPGRPPKPKRLLQIQGTLKAERHGAPETWFDLPPEVPKPPDWLKGDALKRWLEVCADPIYSKVLASLDAGALLAHCVAFEKVSTKYQRGEEVLAADLAALRNTCSMLGLSPSDRARISLPAQPKVNKWAEFVQHGISKPS
jgi:phage terminase small subunit